MKPLNTRARAGGAGTSSPERATLPAIAPPIIDHAGPLLARYDALFCDVWGVVHDGHRAFEPACAALARFRAEQGPVLLVSNAPVPEARVAHMLDERAVPREAYDGIVTSGDIALTLMREAGYAKVHLIGPRARDATFFAEVTARDVAIAEAEAIVCTGLEDDEHETQEHYRARLAEAQQRGLPFVCANPDFVVDVGGRHYLCAGALADLYLELGGEVMWAGKPHASAYETALARAEAIFGRPIGLARILAVGDSVRTDIRGAVSFGIDALFVASGIHNSEVVHAGVIDTARLATLFKSPSARAVAAATHLEW